MANKIVQYLYMAATNVQAFSGDVDITSNLEVGTANLFVDTLTGRVGIGKTNPGSKLDVEGVIVAKDTAEPEPNAL